MRKAGQLDKDGNWLVLSESAGDDPGPYTHNCGNEIKGAIIAHPIWDGPFPCSGSGQCEYETIPYCPICEDAPSYSGSPITRR